MLDLGTGTGRMLELFAARLAQAIGIDSSHYMLDYARSRLAGRQFEHCQVRQGDITDLVYEDSFADVVILHQVLHYLIEPEKAIAEAARILKPGGHLLVIDFAPHNLDFLREKFAHERLGFSDDQIGRWLAKAGLASEQFVQLTAKEIEGEQKLTVSLWLAGYSPEVSLEKAPSNRDEETDEHSHTYKRSRGANE